MRRVLKRVADAAVEIPALARDACRRLTGHERARSRRLPQD